MNKNLIYITAGEESGDLLGSSVIKALKKSGKDLKFKGIGGELMKAEGLEEVFSTGQLGFMGFIELVKHTFFIRKVFKAILKKIIEDEPAVILMIDFSEFHLKLALKLRQLDPDIRIVKYVSPQIWASRSGRIDNIVKAYDCLCCILPFEPEIYKEQPIDCRYVGHPLLEKFQISLEPAEFAEKFFLSTDKTMVSIFPGSRKQEIKKHLPVLKKFMKNILKVRDDIEFVICLSGNIPEADLDLKDLSGTVKIIPSEYQWEIMKYSDRKSVV